MFVCCVSEETTTAIMAPKRVSVEPDIYNGMAAFIICIIVSLATDPTARFSPKKCALVHSAINEHKTIDRGYCTMCTHGALSYETLL